MKEGKTTLALFLAFQHSSGVIAWDPRGMMDGFRVSSGEEMLEAIRNKKWIVEENKFAAVQHVRPICYVPESPDLQEDFHEFCMVAFPPKFTRRNFACIIDEAAQLQKANWINPDLDRAVRQHPRDVVIIQTTHSLQDFHRASKDLMNDLYIFQLQGRSLEAAVDYCDGSPEMREAIKTLPPHTLVHFCFERHDGPEFEVWSDPTVWFMPLDPQAQSLQDTGANLGGGASVSEMGVVGSEAPARPSVENDYQGWIT